MADKAASGIGVCIAVLAVTAAATFFIEVDLQRKYSLLRLQYFIMFTLVMALLSKWTWNSLTALIPRTLDTAYSRGCVWLYRLGLLTFLLLSDFSFVIGHYFMAVEPYFISRLAFLCLGLKLLLLSNLVIWNLVFAIISRLTPGLRTRFNQSKLKAAVAILLCICVCLQGFQTVSTLPRVVQVTVPLAKLPLSLNGTKIAQLSDIHLGPSVGKSMLDRAVDLVLPEKPDLVVITGDLVDASVKSLGSAVQPLQRLQAIYGTFFVTGNHEYLTGDVDAWLQNLETLGIKCLHNSHAVIQAKNKEDRIFLAGVDDIMADRLNYKGHGFKLEAALNEYDSKDTTILLAHQPNAAKQALSQYPDIDLILSGHTHGGQFFPFSILVYLGNPFFAGLYHYNGSYVYVSSGTFYYSVPLRLGSTPEITILTLVVS